MKYDIQESNYQHNETKRITKFLWWCAGADAYFLSRSPMQDRVKYAGIGGIVLCTGVLAAFSGGFAFHTIFGPKGEALEISALTTLTDTISSVIFGLLWGLVIFNLDRFIISSTGKGDGTDEITPREWRQAFPRILIAVILGFAISAPLEIQILKSEIDAELQKYQTNFRQELDQATLKVENKKRAELEKSKDEFDFKISNYQKELKTYDDQIDKLIAVQQAEMQDKRAYGFGPVAKKMQADIDAKRAEKEKFVSEKKMQMEALDRQLAVVKSNINKYDLNLDKAYAKNKLIAGNYSGILKRIQISHEVGGLIPWVILAVLLSIETGPIIFKMMMNKGVYDFLVENHNKKQEVENGIWREHYTYEGKNGLIHMEKWQFMEVELAKKEKHKKLQEQQKLNDQAIEEWGKLKSSAIQKNPTAFFTEGDQSITENNA
jgi:hypothetical protein